MTFDQFRIVVGVVQISSAIGILIAIAWFLITEKRDEIAHARRMAAHLLHNVQADPRPQERRVHRMQARMNFEMDPPNPIPPNWPPKDPPVPTGDEKDG